MKKLLLVLAAALLVLGMTTLSGKGFELSLSKPEDTDAEGPDNGTYSSGNGDTGGTHIFPHDERAGVDLPVFPAPCPEGGYITLPTLGPNP